LFGFSEIQVIHLEFGCGTLEENKQPKTRNKALSWIKNLGKEWVIFLRVQIN
jgi:hypothetical protein